MKETINASLLYISTFLNVNVAMFARENADFQLPSPYASRKENQIVRQFLSQSRKNVICFIQDHLMIHYCLAIIEGQAALIGPYRTGRISRQDIPFSMFESEKAWKEFFHYYESLPDIAEQHIHQAALLLFVGIFGGEVNIPEKIINMREFEKGAIPTATMPEDELQPQPFGENPIDLELISLVRAGNYTGALRLYHKVMRSRGRTFILINTIEGITNIRVQVRIALAQAGIPNTVSGPLFQHFKMKGRKVTSVDEAMKLSEDLIRKSCELVQDFRTKDYSTGIRSAVNFIHSNLSDELSTPLLAEKAGLSPNRFSTRFHDEVGLTPSAYILRERMNTAAEQLRFTNLDIQHISAGVGILDSNYFTRCFKKQFDMSPTEYRRQHGPDGAMKE